MNGGGIYLDFNATTPVHPRVREAISEALDGPCGNPSSLHAFGRRARDTMQAARIALAEYLRVEPDELFFTSGGTESNNLWVLGLGDDAITTTAVEHPSLLEPVKRRWRQYGQAGECPLLPVEADGRVEDTVSVDSGWVSMQWVNNETGVIQDLAHWRRKFARDDVLLHTDAAQACFRMRERIGDLGVDAATITAHKSFGPLGIGLLYLRRGVVLESVFVGGPQERRLRPGTESVALIHGFGVLAGLAAREELWPLESLTERRNEFAAALVDVPGLRMLTPLADGLAFPNVCCVAFEDLDAETLIVHLDREGFAASTGSACASGRGKSSTVLAAMGVGDRWRRGALRFSFGPDTTTADLAGAAEALRRIAERLRRSRSPG